MANSGKGTGKASKKEGLQKAFDRAWDDAQKNGGQPGRYTAQIEVECENPITTYIVVIQPTG
jgi:hypothetical protein